MKHREIARLVISLDAAVDCAISQYKLCKEVFNETAGWCRSSEFCDLQLFHVLNRISGICTIFYFRGEVFRLKRLKPCVEELRVTAQTAWSALSAEPDDGVRHTQLKFFVEALQVVERRLSDCMYLYE